MSRIERIEGRHHAAAILQSIVGMPAAFVMESDIVQNLKASIEKRPGDWADGVRDILGLLESSHG